MSNLKYFSKNFFDDSVVNQSGVFVTDGYGTPSDVIDIESKWTRPMITKTRERDLLETLPPIDSQSKFYLNRSNTGKEDILRSSQTKEKKPCHHYDPIPFYQRHFQIFDGLPVKPNENWRNHVHLNYKGENSRYFKKVIGK